MSLPVSTSAPSLAWPDVGRLEEEVVQGHHSVSATDGECFAGGWQDMPQAKTPSVRRKPKPDCFSVLA